MKEYLYKCKYPHVPFFRIRHDHCRSLGWDGAGKALATWILSSRLDQTSKGKARKKAVKK